MRQTRELLGDRRWAKGNGHLSVYLLWLGWFLGKAYLRYGLPRDASMCALVMVECYRVLVFVRV